MPPGGGAPGAADDRRTGAAGEQFVVVELVVLELGIDLQCQLSPVGGLLRSRYCVRAGGFQTMEYVMVPVPDEFVVDVMQYVARLVARSSVVPWTKEGIEEFFDAVEETTKSLLSLVARYTVADKEVGYDEATEALELSQREIRAIVREINVACPAQAIRAAGRDAGSLRRPPQRANGRSGCCSP